MKKYNILFIDSDSITREMLVNELRMEDCEFTLAHTGEEAFVQIRMKKFAVVLSDYRLPHMSGLQALRKIKDMSNDSVRILFTSFPSTDLYERAINQAEVFKVLTKPYSIEDLKLVIKRALDFYQLKQDNRDLISQLSREAKKQSRIAADIKKKYTHLFHSISEGYFQTDKNGLVTNINSAGAKILGYDSIKEVLKKKISIDNFYPDSETRKRIYHILKKEQVIENEEIEIRRKDGSTVYVETTTNAIIGSNNKFAGYEGIFRDVSKQKGYQQQLDTATAYLRLIQDHIGEGILVVDRNFRIKSVNNYVLNTLKKNYDEVINEYCHKVFTGLDVPCADCIAKETFSSGKVVYASRIRNDPSINAKHIELATYPIFDENRNVVEVIETIKDISHRVITESKLRQTERLYKNLVENISDAVLADDHEGNVVFVNSKFLEYFECTEEEIIGKSFLEIIHDDDKERIKHYHEQRVEGKSMPSIYELKALSKTGKILFVEAAVVIRNESGKPDGTLAVIRDITFRREAEMKLERYTALLERKVNDLSLMNVISKELQSVLKLNDVLKIALIAITAREGFNFDRAFILLKDDSNREMICEFGLEQEAFEQEFREKMKKGRAVFSFEGLLSFSKSELSYLTDRLEHIYPKLRFSLQDDQHLLVKATRKKVPHILKNKATQRQTGKKIFDLLDVDEFVVAPLVSKNKGLGLIIADRKKSGRPIRKDTVDWMGVLTNLISLAVENSRVYDTLEETIFKLEEMHMEIRENQDKLIQAEKLSTIGELTSYIAHEIKNPLVAIGGFANSIRKNLDEEDPNVNFIEIIHKEALRLEKLITELLQYSRPMKPKFDCGHIHSLIDDVIEMLQGEVAKNIEIRREYDSNIGEFSYDSDQLRQVFINLIRNAFQAMPEGGNLKIRTVKAENRAIIHIVDTGSGISKDNMKRLFQPFFTTKSKGTGIGLSVCRQIIKNHYGEISADSEPGKGTKFIIELPLEQDAGYSGKKRNKK